MKRALTYPEKDFSTCVTQIINDLDPSYGIHLHDPRMMEYMGAPESARLLGRTPENWLEHMGRERTIQAALRLHHDASLIISMAEPPPYGRTSRAWDFLLVMKSGCAGGRGFAPWPGQ